ncbi:MAG: AAA family ATPase [Thermoplasmata archaeon]
MNTNCMKLILNNFRSIKKETMDIAPLTIMYGNNGSGKSSFMYALMTLKNIFLNPNQSPDGFFNYQFISIGGYDQVVHSHNAKNPISIEIKLDEPLGYTFGVKLLSKNEGQFSFVDEKRKINISLKVTFPYPLNQSSNFFIETSKEPRQKIEFYWNGLTFNIKGNVSPEVQQEVTELQTILNGFIDIVKKIQIVPVKRGFFKPTYSPVGISSFMLSEDEIATRLAQNKYLEYEVSSYLEKVFDKELRVRPQIGTSIFSIDALERPGNNSSELVNEGFGLNQLVYLLAKVLDDESEIILIEEPEIHLHPKACNKLAKALAEIAIEKNKKILISTHSEIMVSSALNLIPNSKIKPDQLKLYWVKREHGNTTLEYQEANEKGQIVGGLKNFLEAELEVLTEFTTHRT